MIIFARGGLRAPPHPYVNLSISIAPPVRCRIQYSANPSTSLFHGTNCAGGRREYIFASYKYLAVFEHNMANLFF